jgi:hypothetical protein
MTYFMEIWCCKTTFSILEPTIKNIYERSLNFISQKQLLLLQLIQNLSLCCQGHLSHLTSVDFTALTITCYQKNSSLVNVLKSLQVWHVVKIKWIKWKFYQEGNVNVLYGWFEYRKGLCYSLSLLFGLLNEISFRLAGLTCKNIIFQLVLWND